MAEKEKIKVSVQTNPDNEGWVEEFVYIGKTEMGKLQDKLFELGFEEEE